MSFSRALLAGRRRFSGAPRLASCQRARKAHTCFFAAPHPASTIQDATSGIRGITCPASSVNDTTSPALRLATLFSRHSLVCCVYTGLYSVATLGRQMSPAKCTLNSVSRSRLARDSQARLGSALNVVRHSLPANNICGTLVSHRALHKSARCVEEPRTRPPRVLYSFQKSKLISNLSPLAWLLLAERCETHITRPQGDVMRCDGVPANWDARRARARAAQKTLARSLFSSVLSFRSSSLSCSSFAHTTQTETGDTSDTQRAWWAFAFALAFSRAEREALLLLYQRPIIGMLRGFSQLEPRDAHRLLFAATPSASAFLN